MKNTIKLLAIVLIIAATGITLAACGRQHTYVGEYKSVWVEGNYSKDSPTPYYSMSATLSIKKDKKVTLVITRETTYTYIGKWTGNISKDTYAIICTFEHMFDETNTELATRVSYITFEKIEDGKFIANAGVIGSAIPAGQIMVFERI